MCSTPTRAPKLLIAVEWPSTGGCWNPPEKDTPCSKTKKKLQWDGRRSAIMIKSNPICTRWVTHKLENNNTKEVSPLLWRFWTPLQASQTGNPSKGLGIPRESDLEGQWDLIIRLPQDWRYQRLQSWRAQTKYCTHQDPEKRSSDSTGDWTQSLLVRRVACGGVGRQAVTTGMGPLAAAVWEGPTWHKHSWSLPLTLAQSPEAPGLNCLRPNNYQEGSAAPLISRKWD